ncbi:MAG: hypothetical protein SGJ15_07590 [Bacteroidota bacterium]|nr:hypothetical protein [Bacteroidota bacterium]
MSKINLNNYEAYMLDHLEGNLSPQDTLALKAFAILHPELELNFDEELIALENESISFKGKQNFKVDFSDELVIGYLENVLEGEEKLEAEKLALNNTVFKHELELYKKTIAVTDATIVFENKESLKRSAAVIFFPQNNYIRVAAALLLLLGIWFMVSRVIKQDTIISTEMASKLKEEELITPNQIVPETDNTPEVKYNANKLIAKKTNPNNNVNNITPKNEIITSTISVIVPEKQNEPQLADRNLNNEQPENRIDTNNEQLASNNTSESTGPKYIIEEGADNEIAATPQAKSKLWNVASGLLKRLNRRGVENVNSSENNNEMFIGALTISKPN